MFSIFKNFGISLVQVLCLLVQVFSILVSFIMKANINKTFIALICKVKIHNKSSEFLHIGVCNMLYKIISKTISDRLKGVPLILCLRIKVSSFLVVKYKLCVDCL